MANGNTKDLEGITEPVINAIQWVTTALVTIGLALVIISLIKVAIKMANADSPETAQKCKKQIIYCIVGAVLLVAAEVAIPLVAKAIKDYAEQYKVDIKDVVNSAKLLFIRW